VEGEVWDLFPFQSVPDFSLVDDPEDCLINAAFNNDLEGVKEALKYNANINAKKVHEINAGPYMGTIWLAPALIWASFQGNAAVAKYLVSQGADQDAADSWKHQTALDWAWELRHIPVISFLEEQRKRKEALELRIINEDDVELQSMLKDLDQLHSQNQQQLQEAFSILECKTNEAITRYLTIKNDFREHLKSKEKDIFLFQKEVRAKVGELQELDRQICSFRNEDIIIGISRLVEQADFGQMDEERLSSVEILLKKTLRQVKEKKECLLRKRAIEEQNLCCVCLSNPRSILLLPCQHVCVCEDCKEKVNECPLDHTAIEQRIKVFL